MLVLSRKEGETLIINKGEIKITVVGIGGGQVKIGIDAPRQMPIDREEIHLRKMGRKSASRN